MSDYFVCVGKMVYKVSAQNQKLATKKAVEAHSIRMEIDKLQRSYDKLVAGSYLHGIGKTAITVKKVTVLERRR